MVQPDQGEFDRLEFLAWIASRLNRIEAGATARAEFYSANAIGRLLGEVGDHVRLGADAAVTDPAAIRAQFEADAVAEAAKPENSPLVQWAAQDPSLREGSTVRVPGVGEL
jgi:hypothetical protein